MENIELPAIVLIALAKYRESKAAYNHHVATPGLDLDTYDKLRADLDSTRFILCGLIDKYEARASGKVAA